MKRVKFWSRTASGSLVLREGYDPSAVPMVAWKTINRAFFRWYRGESWYPLDPMVAYQRAAQAMIQVADAINSQPSTLNSQPSTYIISAGLTQLKDFGKYRVAPTRASYRALANAARIRSDGENEARGEDKSDREWMPGSASSLNVQAYAESLAGPSGYECVASQNAARQCLLETLPKLDPDASRGFHCYLAAAGNWRRAAELMSLPCSTYCRHFQLWSTQFKEFCKWL